MLGHCSQGSPNVRCQDGGVGDRQQKASGSLPGSHEAMQFQPYSDRDMHEFYPVDLDLCLL